MPKAYKRKILEDGQLKGQLRTDFMQGNGKAGARDALVRQKASPRRRLSAQEITDLYASSAMVQTIIDTPANDLTRAGWTINMKDKKVKDALESKLRQLRAKDAFNDMYRYDRMYGDGFISIGTVEDHTHTLEDELIPEKIKRIPYINAFSNQVVSNFYINEDMFDENYGKVELFEVSRRKNDGKTVSYSMQTMDKVHHSRLIHQQSKRLEFEHEGLSLIESLYDIITVLDTSLWSVGQMLYDYSFKVFKSNDVDTLTKDEKAELGMLMDYKFRTEALAIIGADEELDKRGTPASGINDLLSFVWDFLAGSVKIPKTILKGQEAGTLTGAEYDVMNYYTSIAAIQENELRPQLERLVRLLMVASDELGGSVDPDSIEWSIEFNPLWNVDAKTDAEIRKLLAETDKIYIETGVLSSEDVNDVRFGRFGLTESSKYNADAADESIDVLAKAVKEGYEAHLKNKQVD
ncbi:anti-CBASS protein Acb1 family protein [Desemzia sp. FAM 23990]|uniref:anti-CBASS protein Acb1 family protein n=1 Tax=Desemzia sp. FAM 23990 TaxID=3259520 RepID=UPI003889AEAF